MKEEVMGVPYTYMTMKRRKLHSITLENFMEKSILKSYA